jgi:deoxyribodipyrimidine photo-lyase
LKNYALHWFRRDLRIVGNPALLHAWKRFEGRVLGIFCFDSKFLSRSDFSHNRFHLFLKTLESLQKELQSKGGDLLFLDTGPKAAFEKLFHDLKAKNLELPRLITFNRDYEPFAVERDSDMSAFFHKNGIEVQTERDHLLIEPNEIFKPADPSAPYQVFSPYQKRWLEVFHTESVQNRIAFAKRSLSQWKKNSQEKLFNLTWNEPNHLLLEYIKKNETKVTVPIPKVGTEAALDRLELFRKQIEAYSEQRDIPGIDGTSHFSLYFKNGTITGSQVITLLDLKPFSISRRR